MSTRTKLILIAVVLVGVIAAVAAYALFATKPAPTPRITPSTSPTPTESPGVVSANTVYEEDIEGAEARFPVLSHVPKITPYWEVEYLGGEKEDGKIPLTVTIYVQPDQNADEEVQKQRRFIEIWLGEIGQQAGTYVLKVSTRSPHTY